MEFYECSALTGDNINEIFVNSCKIINNNIKKGIYDLNDPSNGIQIFNLEDDMEINKTYNSDNITYNSSLKLDRKKHLKNQNERKKCG